MTYTNKTNLFFTEIVYDNLFNKHGSFAMSPVSWALCFPAVGSGDNNLFILAVFWPILVPATIVTFVISLALAAISILAQGLSLLVAGALDALPVSTVSI